MTSSRPLALRIFLISVIAIVSAVALAGLFLSGSPVAERMRRLDTQRVNDLQQISYAIDTYWGMQQRLPERLDQLQTTRDVYVSSIRDPQTQKDYDYLVTASSSYQLCADFQALSEPTGPASLRVATLPHPDKGTPFWSHTAGHTCFSLTVRLPVIPAMLK